MTTIADVWQAGVNAVIADPTLNRGGFVDAMQTVVTRGISNAEGNAYVDAVAAEYNRLGIINNPTYANMRGEIVNEGAVTAMALYEALAVSLNALPDAVPILQATSLFDLREDRDQINNALDRCDALIAAEPAGTVGRLVKEVLRDGKGKLIDYRQAVRNEIQQITGDPDN